MKIIFKTMGMFMLFALSSCTKEYVATTVLPTSASFSADIQPIFTSKCVGCHGGSTNPNLTSGNAYAALTSGNYVIANDATNSKLYKRLNAIGGSIMPPSGKLSASDLNKILVWINNGAKND